MKGFAKSSFSTSRERSERSTAMVMAFMKYPIYDEWEEREYSAVIVLSDATHLRPPWPLEMKRQWGNPEEEAQTEERVTLSLITLPLTLTLKHCAILLPLLHQAL